MGKKPKNELYFADIAKEEEQESTEASSASTVVRSQPLKQHRFQGPSTTQEPWRCKGTCRPFDIFFFGSLRFIRRGNNTTKDIFIFRIECSSVGNENERY